MTSADMHTSQQRRLSSIQGLQLACLLTVISIGFGCHGPGASGANGSADATRQEVVASRGASVMPFDLDRSTHVFEKTDTGGTQQVVSDDNDADQIRLIREHLAEESEKFSKGDFHDPSMIHGEDMAGLHQLVTGFDKLTIVYSEIEAGGQIVYSTQDTIMVLAIHQWFEAQVSDHGRHAQGSGLHKH